jgi:hypothetical protein
MQSRGQLRSPATPNPVAGKRLSSIDYGAERASELAWGAARKGNALFLHRSTVDGSGYHCTEWANPVPNSLLFLLLLLLLLLLILRLVLLLLLLLLLLLSDSLSKSLASEGDGISSHYVTILWYLKV